MVKLVFADSRFAGGAWPCVLSRTTVGRAADNAVVLPDPSVSAYHCEVLVHGGEVIVRDLGSSNGTFVNGTRLSNQQAPARNGDRVQFGNVEARVEIAPGEVDPGDTEITAIYSHGRVLRRTRRPGDDTPR
jgi:pSer/pThr/pTyr-binding forkhead associated (FHA) protein